MSDGGPSCERSDKLLVIANKLFREYELNPSQQTYDAYKEAHIEFLESLPPDRRNPKEY